MNTRKAKTIHELNISESTNKTLVLHWIDEDGVLQKKELPFLRSSIMYFVEKSTEQKDFFNWSAYRVCRLERLLFAVDTIEFYFKNSVDIFGIKDVENESCKLEFTSDIKTSFEFSEILFSSNSKTPQKVSKNIFDFGINRIKQYLNNNVPLFFNKKIENDYGKKTESRQQQGGFFD